MTSLVLQLQGISQKRVSRSVGAVTCALTFKSRLSHIYRETCLLHQEGRQRLEVGIDRYNYSTVTGLNIVAR